MAGNGWKLQKLLESMEMAENSWKWIDMAGIAGNSWKLLLVLALGPGKSTMHFEHATY